VFGRVKIAEHSLFGLWYNIRNDTFAVRLCNFIQKPSSVEGVKTLNTVGRSLKVRQSSEQECKSGNSQDKDIYDVLNLLSFFSGWVSIHPQTAPQLKEEIFDLMARYVESPRPDIYLRVPVSLDLWDRFVQACGKEGYCVERAISVFLMALEGYAKYFDRVNNIENNHL
jgi:hypothetical protein